MEFWAITDRGLVRKKNQDTFACFSEDGVAFLLVCDGMGGAKAGDVASKLCATVFTDEVKKHLSRTLTEDELRALLEGALDTANEAVWKLGQADKDCTGMGTTIVCAVVRDGEATFLNVGDSRAYRLSGGAIHQVTRDHSVVEDMIRRGEITRAEARTHPKKNLITRALGTSPSVKGDLFSATLKEGDWLLLCSDGLSNLFTDEELHSAVAGADAPEKCGVELLARALGRGAPDNVTIVLYRE